MKLFIILYNYLFIDSLIIFIIYILHKAESDKSIDSIIHLNLIKLIK